MKCNTKSLIVTMEGGSFPLSSGLSPHLRMTRRYTGDTYRTVYTTRLKGVLYVLHTFQKKSTGGIATPQRHIGLVRQLCETPKRSIRQQRETDDEHQKSRPPIASAPATFFANLGLPMPRSTSSRLPLVKLKRLMAEREITQTYAAKLVEIKQQALSKLLRSHFKLVSMEKLMRMLTAFDQDVEITVDSHRKRGEAGRITLIPV
ncbi:XRE family transcriptional regulator [Bradyrhizobium sp. 27S5]|uniref:XRE family transcriptional regulator n=1 Tax=Bradyrhizobium sp. 27S5 TaxID=3139728 RepID=UPI0039C882F8